MRGTDLGFREPFLKLAVLPPLYRSMMRSLISTDVLRDVCFGGSSLANDSVDMHDLSIKKAFDPLTCSPDKSETKQKKHTQKYVQVAYYL